MARHTPITIPTDFRYSEQKKYRSLSMSASMRFRTIGIGAGARWTVNFELKRGVTVPVATGWS